jgi:SAM-dependent methyltransferase
MKELPRIITSDHQLIKINKILSKFIINYYQDKNEQSKSELRILEAGCGQEWKLDLNGLDYKLIGLDLSKEALEIRMNNKKDLDEIIVGDLQAVELNASDYDMIYSCYVLEHLNKAEAVMKKLFGWLKPGGLLILIIPDRNTVKSFIARITPHWFHIFIYKYLYKEKDAGKPGYAPFPTFLNPIVSKEGISDYCSINGHKISLELGLDFEKKAGFFSLFYAGFSNLITKLSGGKIRAEYIDIMYIIEKSGVPK